jgi:hypothetical protein
MTCPQASGQARQSAVRRASRALRAPKNRRTRPAVSLVLWMVFAGNAWFFGVSEFPQFCVVDNGFLLCPQGESPVPRGQDRAFTGMLAEPSHDGVEATQTGL